MSEPIQSRQHTLLGVIAILVMTFAAYGPALNGGFIWDDDDYVSELDVLDEPGGLGRIWFQDESTKNQLGKQPTPQYYPVVFTTFWIENQIWGRGADDTLGYHIVNVLLHAASAVLVWRILVGLGLRGAWLIAAVFALHPAHVESVAWITERKNVLSGVLYLSALLAYLRCIGLVSPQSKIEAQPASEAKPRKKSSKQQAKQVSVPASPRKLVWPYYWLAVALFAGALLSKSVTASLPAAILLLVYWKRGRIRLTDVAPLLPLFVMGFTAGNHTAEVERTNVFVHEVDLGVHGLEHLLVAGRAVWFYAGKLLFPVNLSFMYPRWPLDTGSFVQWLYPLLAVGVVAGAWIARKRLGRAPLVALLFFGGTLIPALGFVDVFPMYYSYVADHFQYLASLGVIALVVGASASIIGRSGLEPRLAGGIGALLLLCLAARTWDQCHDYSDLRTLWKATLERNPGSMMVAINLSNQVLREDKDEAEANRILEKALENVAPGVHPTMHARARFNYGNNLGNLGDFEQAIANYRRALEIDPNYIKAYFGLGWAYERLQQTADALENYELYLTRLNALGRDEPTTRQRIELLRKRLR